MNESNRLKREDFQDSLELGAGASRAASDAELAGAWRDRLHSSVVRFLQSAPRIQAAPMEEARAIEWSFITPAQLLDEPHPCAALLTLLKDAAKMHRAEGRHDVPPPVATAIYYLSITLALDRLDQRITTLDDAAMLGGIDWMRKQVWLDAATLRLCRAMRTKLVRVGGVRAR